MYFFFRRKAVDFFSPQQKSLITNAIQQAETNTSGEIRVFIESKCAYVNAIDRAKELFEQLNMYHTADRNAVLVYIAIKHRQLAIWADEGIHQQLGSSFWQQQVNTMIYHFNSNDYAEGIASIVTDIGTALTQHFPYDKVNDVNELPNDIVFGK